MNPLTLSVLILINLNAFTTLPTDGVDLSEALRLSLMFYEAQRSGKLPENSRISWRGDSALQDAGPNGEDLTGGYYDASDFVKFGFTTAFTTTLLSWGLISYKDAFMETGQYQFTLDAIKWATDYFIKCHTRPHEFYGQVGDFDLDHLFWGRPEELNMSRPAYKIDEDNPGSDLAGEVAASLAATSIIFQKINKTYSKITLKHSKELYEFATKYQGLYNDAIPGAKKYYESKDYGDEITWAALWLYKATNDSQYLEDAKKYYKNFELDKRPNEFFYNKKNAGVQVLLAQSTQLPEYLDAVFAFCDYSIDEQKRTPKGLIYIDKFGTLSHAANIGFICLQAADLLPNKILQQKYINFASQQINYILRDTGRSFIVGYGTNYPKQPHHAASSCPNLPEKCDWSSYSNPGPNPQILLGALVSGPDENDLYMDTREEYLYNEVSLDYNAGFTTLCAGLIHRKILNRNESFSGQIINFFIQ